MHARFCFHCCLFSRAFRCAHIVLCLSLMSYRAALTIGALTDYVPTKEKIKLGHDFKVGSTFGLPRASYNSSLCTLFSFDSHSVFDVKK